MLEELADLEVSPKDIADLVIGVIDENDDGEVDLGEARAARDALGLNVSDEELERLGQQLDKSGNQKVDSDELAAWLEGELGECDSEADEEDDEE